METERLTAAQALIRFLASQYVVRDGVKRRFFGGCFGILGHGNIAGLGEALYEARDLLTYYQARNEQAMVHAAAGYARMHNRLGALVCTTSIGPGATNMVTGAALATVNRLPVLLLPGDVFASRRSDPVLQQLEMPWRGETSVNDCFQPVSRYFDRITRPEQVIPAALNAMRVLTNQAETGAVTLAFPQDVQTEAYDYPLTFLRDRIWHIRRPLPPTDALGEAIALISKARRPLIVAGGGVIYSEATDAVRGLVEATGIPEAETQAGKGTLPYNHPSCLGAIGSTGTLAANRIAAEADVVIGIGTRWSDFTTASKSAFKHPAVRFVNINVADLDGAKHSALGLIGDARATIEALTELLDGWSVDDRYREEAATLSAEWDVEVERIYGCTHLPLPAQTEIVGVLNSFVGPRDVIVCAAGSLPGELHKLWRTHEPRTYHVEYGYSCMGYEIAGGLGVKMADPEREVYVLVGDGSYLMMSSEIVTSIQERLKLTIILVDNHGFNSIGALSRSLGMDGFGTLARFRNNGSLGLDSDESPSSTLPTDLGANAASLGAHLISVRTVDEFRQALVAAARIERTVVIHIEVDRYASVQSYETWWEVAVAEVSAVEGVARAREDYERDRSSQHAYLG